jgi:hypothetical protein
VRALAAALALALAAAPRPAAAQAQAAASAAAGGVAEPAHDYELSSGAWNGLATFVALARGMGVEVETTDRLDWSSLGAGDALVILYPTAALAADDLTSFLDGGGRLLLGDDFGTAAATLAALHLVRQDAVGLVAERYHEQHDALPVARALAGDHPLAAGVAGLTCNHPSLFTTVDGPTSVFGFGEREVVVAAGEVGRGRFVALSDPSVLINRMLELEGNLAFAQNLIGHLLGADGRRLVVVTGSFGFRGEPPRPPDQPGLGGVLDKLNRFLAELSEYSMEAPAMRIFALVLALGAALAALRVLPRRAAPLDGSWARLAPPGGGPADGAALVAALDASGAQGYLVPAAIVRDTVVLRLGALLGVDDPLAMGAAELGRAVEASAGAPAAAELARVLPLVRDLPSRGQAESPWRGAAIGRREFDRLAAAAERLYRSLDGAPSAGGA